MTTTDTAATGRIITFYSYKGGTGRTMALANIAWVLAANGYRVLTVDWDLESPGLHRYFHPFLKDKDLRTSDGIIDLIRKYSEAMTNAEPPADWTKLADIQDYAVSLTWDFEGGGIDFVAAGRQNDSYARVVSTFDWDAFWKGLQGGQFLDDLRENLRAGYDFVLIDSRTGLSDTAGICTVKLPDALVNCFTLNTQSIEGAAAVARSITRWRGDQPLLIYPVPTRVEDGEQRKLERGRTFAHRSFAPFLSWLEPQAVDEYWGSVELPYRPFYAYEEVLAAFGDPPRQENSLLAPYVRLASRLAGRTCHTPAVAEQVRQRVLQEFERPAPIEPITVLISYAPLDRIYAEWIRYQLRRASHRATLHYAGSPLPDLDKSDRVVALISRDYVTFPEAEDLWRLCALRDQPESGLLIPVHVDGTPLPAQLDDRVAVDFANIGGDRAAEALFKALDIAGDAPRFSSADREEIGIRYPGQPTPHWNVKLVRNTRFSGRHVLLETVRNRLVGGRADGSRLVLEGINGVGKTQLALEYTYRFAAAYDVIWWISAEQPARVRTALTDLAIALGLGASANADDQVAAVKESLRRGVPSRRWLVVVDNADDPAALRDLIPSGPGHVIITTRNPGWHYEMPKLDVGVFHRGESVELLLRRAPGLAAGDADQLAENLGDLPLALEQAGAWLAVTGMPARTYLAELNRRAADLLAEQAPPDYQLSTTGTVRVSLDRLRQQNPAAARLLELFAFLAPEAIPYRIVASRRLSELLARYDDAMHDPLLHGTLIRELGRYALARIDSTTGGVVVHRLTQQIVRAGLGEQEQATNREEIQEILAAAERGEADDRANWQMYEEIRSHLEYTGALESAAVAVRKLVIDMVRYLRRRSDHRSSQELAEKALARWRVLFDANDQQTLLMRLQLANALRDRGLAERAYDADREVYDRLKGALGERHAYTLMAAGGLAADHRDLGNYAEARRLDTQTVPWMSEELGENHERALKAVNNLAVSLRLTGKVAEATSLDRENLTRARRKLGPGHPSTLLYTSNYGRDLRQGGDLRKSRTTLEDVFQHYRSALGDEHRDTWLAAKNYAVTLRRMGEIEKAQSVIFEASEQIARLLGHQHPETAASDLERACVLWAMGQADGACKLADKVYDFYRRRSGDRHPFALIAANNLSIFQRAAGDLAGGRRRAESMAPQMQAVLGPGHPYGLVAALNLANALYASGALADAHRRDQEVHAKLGEVFADSHPTVLAASVNLAVSGLALTEGPKETAALNNAAQRCQQLLGNTHPYTAAAQQGVRIDVDIEVEPT